METAMSTLVVKNLPDDVHERLRQLARRNHQSVSQQAMQLIESSVSCQSGAVRRPSPMGARGMTRDELDTALSDRTYSHYQSADELNIYLDELRADRAGRFSPDRHE